MIELPSPEDCKTPSLPDIFENEIMPELSEPSPQTPSSESPVDAAPMLTNSDNSSSTPGLDKILANVASDDEGEDDDEDGNSAEEMEASEEEGDDNGAPKLTRKRRKRKRKQGFMRRNIRPILESGVLDEAAKEAQQAEMERLKRVLEKEQQEKANTLQSLLADDSPDDSIELLDPCDALLAPTPCKVPRIIPDAFNGPKLPPPPSDRSVEAAEKNAKGGSGWTQEDAILLDSDEEEDRKEHEPEESPGPVEGQEDLGHTRDSEGRVLVNRSHPTDDPDCFLAPQLTRAVKPHQIGGIRFLYDNVVESKSQYHSSTGFGCILAHSMGLGKTMQVIAFFDVLFRFVKARNALLIVPVNTIQNWQSEFEMWLPKAKPTVKQEEGSCFSFSNQESESQANSKAPGQSDESEASTPAEQAVLPRTFEVFVLGDAQKTLTQRHALVKEWKEKGGVLLLGYEMFRLLSAVVRSGKTKRSIFGVQTEVKKKPLDPELADKQATMQAELRSSLLDPGPQVVVCDEGHRIKNNDAGISKALKAITTKRRVVLTGYPLQNNLLEYWCMVDFVRPAYLGARHHFTNMFQRPIENGQCEDSTADDKSLMRGRSHVLHSLLSGFVQRRSHAVLKASLPPKTEVVLMVRMSGLQRRLYAALMEALKAGELEGIAQANTLTVYSLCCKIWNHPDILWRAIRNHQDANDFDLDTTSTSPRNRRGRKPNATTKQQQQRLVRAQPSSASLASSVSYGYTEESLLLANSEMGASNSGSPASTSSFNGTNSSFTIDRMLSSLTSPVCESGQSTPKEWTPPKVATFNWAEQVFAGGYSPGQVESGSKMQLCLALVRESLRCGDRVLVFSQSLGTLSLLEDFLSGSPLLPEEPQGDIWSKNVTYYRLDGSTSASERERLIRSFNKSEGRAKLFLLSTRAGCLGVNLVGANRVIMLDVSWNPCHDCQAVCRIYRYGQVKPCSIYRLVSDNTMETKIYERQVRKQGMADRVVDERNPAAALMGNLNDQLTDYEDRDLPFVDTEELLSGMEEDDAVLFNVLSQLGTEWVTKPPFTHESLLVDKRETRLSRSEKERARLHYEAERRRLQGMGSSESTRASSVQSAPSSGFKNVRFPCDPISSLLNHDHSTSDGIMDLLAGPSSSSLRNRWVDLPRPSIVSANSRHMPERNRGLSRNQSVGLLDRLIAGDSRDDGLDLTPRTTPRSTLMPAPSTKPPCCLCTMDPSLRSAHCPCGCHRQTVTRHSLRPSASMAQLSRNWVNPSSILDEGDLFAPLPLDDDVPTPSSRRSTDWMEDTINIIPSTPDWTTSASKLPINNQTSKFTAPEIIDWLDQTAPAVSSSDWGIMDSYQPQSNNGNSQMISQPDNSSSSNDDWSSKRATASDWMLDFPVTTTSSNSFWGVDNNIFGNMQPQTELPFFDDT